MSELATGMLLIPSGILLIIVAALSVVRPVPFLSWLTLKGRSGLKFFGMLYLLFFMGLMGIACLINGSSMVHENLPRSWEPFLVHAGIVLVLVAVLSLYLFEKTKTGILIPLSGYTFAISLGLFVAFIMVVNGPPESLVAGRSSGQVSGCQADINCWGERHRISAQTRCAAPIERLARYGFEWTNDWSGQIFFDWRWATISDPEKLLPEIDRSTLVYQGDKIRFQNRFGAYSDHIYTCHYKPASKTVLKVSARQGRLMRRY